jgi:ATP-binding cassette, subfamily B, bacterial CvaB/MchF/RaxB
MTTHRAIDFSWRRKTPVILQTEAAECGLAALAMVAAYHGHDLDLAILRRRNSISLRGATLGDLIGIASRLDLASRPIKLEMKDLDKVALPAILHWDFNHFVVLTRVGGRHIVVHDPARGRHVVSLEEASRHFTGVALELTPTQDFEPRRDRQQVRLATLVGDLPGLGGAVAQILLLAVVLEIFAVVSPFFMQLIVDHAVVAEDRDLLAVLGLGFLLLGLIQAGVMALRSWLVTVLSTSLNLQLFGRLFFRVLHLPMAFFEKRHIGDIVSRFESLEAIQRGLTVNAAEAILDGLMAMITLTMMLIYSARLAAIVMTAAVLYGILRTVLYGPLRRAQAEQIVRTAKQQSNLIESLQGIQTVKLFNRQIHRQTIYRNLLVETFNAGVRIERLHILFRAANGVLLAVENIAVVWVGALMVLDSAFSLGMLLAFLAYKQLFISRMIGLIEKGLELKMLGLHLERVADIAMNEPERAGAGGCAGSSEGRATTDIEVRNLGFRYSDFEPWVFRNLNFRIAAGEAVAIVGASGCGKTTLLRILVGLLTPVEGEVIVGGRSLGTLDLHDYRGSLATVMQDDQLFSGSLAENICFFDPRADREKIERCSRVAAIHDDIIGMPMGYNTLVGEMGSALSGGQKQRVLVARALYKEPELLFLDEATSHLDAIRERAVNAAIRELNLTRVIVAHRQETIASADRVIVLGQEFLERPE